MIGILAKLYHEGIGTPSQARQEYEKALQTDELNAILHYNLAILLSEHFAQGMMDEYSRTACINCSRVD